MVMAIVMDGWRGRIYIDLHTSFPRWNSDLAFYLPRLCGRHLDEPVGAGGEEFRAIKTEGQTAAATLVSTRLP